MISCADTTATDLAAEKSYSADYLHRWQTYDGCDIRLDYVMTRSGGCISGVDEILTGWPLGSTHDHHDYRIFVRDPQGTSARENAIGFDPQAPLPANTQDTGLRQDGAALWMIPGDDAFMWIVNGASVERWPKERSGFGCA